MIDDNNLFYTVANFANACNLTEAAIRSRIAKGSIKVVRLSPNRVLIPRGYIDKLLNQIPSELR